MYMVSLLTQLKVKNMLNLNVGSVVTVEYRGSDDTVKTAVGTVDNVGVDRILLKLDGQFDILKKTQEKKQAYRTLMLEKILKVSAE
jgi:hypothetical protein